MGLLDAPTIPKDSTGRRLDGFPAVSAPTFRNAFGTQRGAIVAGPASKPAALSALTAVTFQRIYQVYSAAPQIRVRYTNFALPGSNNLTPEGVGAGTYTVKASVVWAYANGANTGTTVPITFARVRTITIGTIGIHEVWESDPIDVPYSQPVGSWFIIRTYVTTSAALIPTNRAVWGGNNNPSTFYEGYLSTDYTDTAGNAFSGSTNDGTNYGPDVLGWDPAALNKTALLTGDSIMGGTGYSASSGSFSFASLALHTAKIGCLNVGHGGEQLTTVLAAYANHRMRLTMAHGCVNALSNYGTNDLYAGARTAAQLKADLLTWWGYLKGKGCAVYQTTILPQNSSTDGWQTIAGQASKNSGADTYRQAVNQWLRAPATAGAGNSALYDAAGNLAGVFDTAKLLEVNADGTATTINAATGAISNGTGGYTYTESTIYATGTVTSIPNAQKLQDTSKAWTVNQWIDYAMVIVTDSTTPAAAGQVRFISANTANTLSTDTAWTTTPSTTATYKIVKVFSLDGTHPSTLGHQRIAAAVDPTLLAAA